MKFWRRLEVVSLIISAVAFLSAIYLSFYLVNTRPKVPEPSEFRIYVHNVHGKVAYLNNSERLSLDLLFSIAGAGFVVGVIVDRSKRPFQKKSQ